MEDENVQRIHFDSTLDEIVDANIRLTTQTQSFRAYRTRAVWVAGGCLGGALFGVVLFRTQREAVDLSVTIWLVLVALAVTLGTGFGYVYGLYVNWAMRRQYRSVVSEQLGGVADVPCDIELRHGGVWVLQNGVEMTFPWANSVGIEDTGDAIELRFRPGLVVATLLALWAKCFERPRQKAFATLKSPRSQTMCLPSESSRQTVGFSSRNSLPHQLLAANASSDTACTSATPNLTAMRPLPVYEKDYGAASVAVAHSWRLPPPARSRSDGRVECVGLPQVCCL